MKIFKLFPLACAALMMSACSSDDGNGSENPNIASEAQYLAVNIVNVGTTPTRSSSTDPNYADGTDAENKINKVRFYFFNADGSPYKLVDTSGETNDGTGVNWLEQKTTTPITEGSTGSVDKILKTVLVIKGSTAAAPAKMVTVINPGTLTTTTLKSDGVVSLSELCDGLNDTKFFTPTSSDFVMTNSAYLEAGRKVCPSLVSGHVETSETDATDNPVDIYVERVAAKVSTALTDANFEVGTAATWGEGLYKTKDPVYTYGADTKIYAVIEGWGVADENAKAMVVKQISDSWTNGNLGITPWNTADYHRCFWESMMPNATGTSIYSNVNHAFNYYKANITTGIKYTLPNTAAAATEYSDKMENNMTKFLVAATLKYQDAAGAWKNAEVCKYRGVEYLGIDNLKEAVATAYNKYYKKVGTAYKELQAADIDFSTTSTITKDYQVVPTLVSTVTEVYKKNATGGYDDVTTVAKADIEQFTADVRKDGKVYYYIPINHLGSAGSVAECGIVRNHWYKVTLKTITGLGTPVYDESKTIDPTTPKDEHTYLAARVNVLQWRVVSQKVDLGK
ncbi:Mfa1 family fimbria major subunit [Prevotella sp.]|uniref:Mfa1 family fimbria major subunit n=1 Tax=Prevotella sp. TaxID=59823 RepID=UPI0027E25D43|nr:Mfa1 family fimbria major subunit [Prevotella sp.]